MKLNLSKFNEFVKTKHRFAQMYSNEASDFSQKNFRKDIFKIKSNLSWDINKDNQLYIPINLGRAITRVYTDYVIWKWFSADFWEKETNQLFTEIADRLNIQQKLNTVINNQSSIGYWIIRLRDKGEGDEVKLRLEVIPVTNYSANTQDLSIGDDFEDINEHFIYSIIKRDDTNIFYVDRYVRENGKRKGIYWEEWEYTQNFVFEKKLKDWKEEELDFLPLFIFNNDLENTHTISNKDDKIGNVSRYFNQSDYIDLADLLQELNDRESQISIEFIKNLTSKMSLPKTYAEAKTTQSLRKKSEKSPERIKNTKENTDWFIHGEGTQPAQYITKDGQYLTIAIEQYLPKLLRFISALSGVPSCILGLDALSWNNPVGTTEKEFTRFYSRITKKQLQIYSETQRLFSAIIALHEGKPFEDIKSPIIKFTEAEIWDIAARTDVADKQMAMGIMTKKSALKYTMGLDDSEAEKELENIKKEIQDDYARDWFLATNGVE